MPSYNDDQGRLVLYGHTFPGEVVLPSNNIILQRTPFTGWNSGNWDTFWLACHTLSKEITVPEYVFIDASWDPVALTNDEILAKLSQLQSIWRNSKVCMLSSKAQHFYDSLPGCVYFPLFLMLNYPDIVSRPKAGRIGCLNRRNAAHRVWLMHHLLDQGLLDPSQDVYSVSFVNLWTNTYFDLNSHLDIKWFNTAQQRWPAQIQTHPDQFPNDYGISHPAWHTGIVIITETEANQNTLICEKTAKGILSKSCFSVYMHEVGYRVLEDLGFSPRFFARHAQEFDIGPIVEICKNFATAQDAIDYSRQHQQQINHNWDWFAHQSGTIQSRPWFACWHPKLNHALESL